MVVTTSFGEGNTLHPLAGKLASMLLATAPAASTVLAACVAGKETILHDGKIWSVIITCPACGYVCPGSRLAVPCPTPICGGLCVNVAMTADDYATACKTWAASLSDLIAEPVAPRWVYANSTRTNEIARDLESCAEGLANVIDDGNAGETALYLGYYAVLMTEYTRAMLDDRDRALASHLGTTPAEARRLTACGGMA